MVKKVPTAVLEKRGSWRAKIRKEPEYSKDVPEPPKHLDKLGLMELENQTKQLHARQLMSKSFQTALGLFCSAYSDYQNAIAYIEKEGMYLVKTTRDGSYDVINPAFKVKDTAFQQMYKIGKEFGFAPASNASIFPSESKSDQKKSTKQGLFGVLDKSQHN